MLLTELNNINTIYYNDCSYWNNLQSKVTELISIFKTKSLTRFNQKDIEKYIKHLKIKGNNNATINNKLAYLSKCLKYYNVKLVIPYQKVKSKEKDIITFSEFENLCNTFKDNQEMIQFIYLAYYTGLRANEILNIRTQHIKTIDDKYFVNIYNTKNHKNNFIPITTKLNNIIDNFIEFTINYKQVYYELAKQGVTAHQFRHTFITKCYEKGLDSFTIMRLTNQSSLSIQQRYVHLSNVHLADSIEVL